MSTSSDNCSICMSLCVFPIQLKCKHVFCFLCIKGVIIFDQINNKCPLCRKKISQRLLNRPKFLRNSCRSDRPSNAWLSHQWFYEGKSGLGFWAYDYVSCQVIETAFSSDVQKCEVIIAGNVYVIDFDDLVQYRKDRPSKKRKIKRELLCNIKEAKGIAGVSKNLVKEVFGPQLTNECSGNDNHSSGNDCGQQSSDNRSSTAVVSNTLEFVNENGIKVKTEIKQEIKTEIQD